MALALGTASGFVVISLVSVATYSEVVFAKVGTTASFGMSVSLADPEAGPAISDNATVAAWVNITLGNPSNRRLTLHSVVYSGWIHDIEVENGSAPERRSRDNFLPLPDGSFLPYFRAFARSVAFPTATEFLEPQSNRTFPFTFTLARDLAYWFDPTLSIARFAQAHNLAWSDINWFHHVVVQVQILGVPSNYEGATSTYLREFPIIEREIGFELLG